MDSLHYTSLLGNLAYGNVEPGIWLENAQHCVIKGNRVYDNQVATHGEGGITLYGNVDYCILEGNKCFDTQGTKTQKYGIDIMNANCNDNVILGNDVRSNLTAGIHDVGTGTIIRNNVGYNPVGISSISVGASPFTHTAGASPETVYVSGGTVSSITKGGNNFGLTTGAFGLEPYESIVVTYS
ncbi:MAG: right-handed parallel beta-helix repeat-containing protein [Candidatus Methanospirareceae archaeon]